MEIEPDEPRSLEEFDFARVREMERLRVRIQRQRELSEGIYWVSAVLWVATAYAVVVTRMCETFCIVSSLVLLGFLIRACVLASTRALQQEYDQLATDHERLTGQPPSLDP